DRNRVFPRNVVGRNTQGGGQALALRRTGGIVAAYDGLDQFRIQSGRGDELVQADSGIFHAACNRLHDGAMLPLSRYRAGGHDWFLIGFGWSGSGALLPAADWYSGAGANAVAQPEICWVKPF